MEVIVIKKRRGRPKSNGPSVVDSRIGQRMRLRRTLLGFSQADLGRRINLTFQQIQKYERGANRISASRLFDLAQVLDVPVSYFYDKGAAGNHLTLASGFAEDSITPYDSNVVPTRETLELARAFQQITDPRVRKRLFEMTKAIAKLYASGEEIPEPQEFFGNK